MAQRRYAIGTAPVLIANPNKIRRSLTVNMLPTGTESGNTGRVHVGKGFPPSSTLGAPNQGDPLTAGTSVVDAESYKDDPSVFKGAWWATASASDQIITVDEISAVGQAA